LTGRRPQSLAFQDVAARVTSDSGTGYWIVTSTGEVFAYGGAVNYGGMDGRHLNKPIVGMASTPDGKGYWLFGADGGVFAFGDADFFGSQGATGTSSPVVGGASTAQEGSGPAGESGPAGPAGATGAAGPAGPAGATGGTGPAGATGAVGPPGPVGPAGSTLGFAEFYALMPPDNTATVAVGGDVEFPGDGPSDGSGLIDRLSLTQFNLADIGTYEVSFQVSVSEAGQLVLALNGLELPTTVVGRATGTSQIVEEALVQTTTVNSVLEVRNPAADSHALTITPLAGGADSVSASLIIQRLQ
jgi:hypothetical protein